MDERIDLIKRLFKALLFTTTLFGSFIAVVGIFADGMGVAQAVTTGVLMGSVLSGMCACLVAATNYLFYGSVCITKEQRFGVENGNKR